MISNIESIVYRRKTAGWLICSDSLLTLTKIKEVPWAAGSHIGGPQAVGMFVYELYLASGPLASFPRFNMLRIVFLNAVQSSP